MSNDDQREAAMTDEELIAFMQPTDVFDMSSLRAIRDAAMAAKAEPVTIDREALRIAEELGGHVAAEYEEDPHLDALILELRHHLAAQPDEFDPEDEHVPLQVAYDGLKAEYAEFRKDARKRLALAAQPVPQINPEATDDQVERVAEFLYENGWRGRRTWRANAEAADSYRETARNVLAIALAAQPVTGSPIQTYKPEPVTGTVEWEYGIRQEGLNNVISVGAPWMDREFAEKVSANDSGNYGVRRRPAGEWVEVN